VGEGIGVRALKYHNATVDKRELLIYYDWFHKELSMIYSMTGYGKGEGGGFVVEMRSVNHKFLDLSMKLSRDLGPLEARIKKVMGEAFSRGRIEVYVYRGGKEEPTRALRLDMEAAQQYIGLLSELKKHFDLPGEVDLKLLSSYGDIVKAEEVTEDAEQVWAAILPPITACCDALKNMRADEGAALALDIRGRAAAIAANIVEVEKHAPAVVTEYQKKLKERVEKLTGGMELDRDRLHQEVALLADRCDVTEEIVRARSHLRQLDDMLSTGGPIGRKLDFLLQEINRELNTIGSKASDKGIAIRVVEMKAELEKVREQAQNIE